VPASINSAIPPYQSYATQIGATPEHAGALGYVCPCHSRNPATWGDLSVLTSEDSSHLAARADLMPRAAHSRIMDPTVSPFRTRSAASRNAAASTSLISSRSTTRLRLLVSSGLA